MKLDAWETERLLFFVREICIPLYERRVINMIAKIKEFCKKPITWGAYFKIVGVASVLSFLISIGYVIYYNLTLRSFYERPCKTQESDED